MDDKLKKTLHSMIIGNTIYNVILIIISTIVFTIIYKTKSDFIISIVKNELCVVIGYIVSVIGLYSMALSLSKAVSANDDNYARRYMTLMSIVRLIVFCIILIILINKNTFGITGGIMYVLSFIGIKVGTYLAPAIEKRL